MGFDTHDALAIAIGVYDVCLGPCAVAITRMSLTTVLVTAVALGGTLIARIRFAFIGAVFFSCLDGTVAQFMIALHRAFTP